MRKARGAGGASVRAAAAAAVRSEAAAGDRSRAARSRRAAGRGLLQLGVDLVVDVGEAGCEVVDLAGLPLVRNDCKSCW